MAEALHVEEPDFSPHDKSSQIGWDAASGSVLRYTRGVVLAVPADNMRHARDVEKPRPISIYNSKGHREEQQDSVNIIEQRTRLV